MKELYNLIADLGLFLLVAFIVNLVVKLSLGQ